VDGALFELELARDARRYGWRQFARTAAAHYCLALIETDELARAEKVLTEDAPLEAPFDTEDAIRLWALAEVRRAQNRPQEAIELAMNAGAVAEQTVPVQGFCPWRTSAAQSAFSLGDAEQARELADQALQRAEATGVLHDRIRALRVAGMCEGGETGLARLRQAVELGESSPPRLETVYALVELGGALRRSNERAASREPLQRAADLARRAGAIRLHDRARQELAAGGARPRRQALLAGPESLTPSERRIAELAAQGASNREIAGALFVTPKTVEYHLRNSYRKLDIRARSELSGALGI
jgi:DNA-binding CsgD family transcriptional regulator